MKTFYDLSIKTKTMAAFGIVLTLTLSLGVFALTRLAAVNDAAAEIRDNWLPATGSLGNLAATTERVRITQSAPIMATTDEDLRNAETRFKNALTARDDAWKAYAATITDGKERELADQLQKEWADYLSLGEHVKAIALHGDRERAGRMFGKEMQEQFARIRDLLGQDIALNTSEGRKAADRAAATYVTARTLIVIVLAIAAALCGALGAVFVRTVSRPVQDMTGAMNRLAARDWTVTVPALGRGDEIGAMAQAVEVFKNNGIENDRLVAEQEQQASAQRAEQERKEARQQVVEDHIATFDRSVTQVLETVTAASNELQTTAASMTATAEETQRQATTVAAAAEQASANVDTVATASEELSASIQEISRQVSESARITQEAVAQASGTNEQIRQLAESAQRIGDVVQLINDIAAQTNLLALNATIEAARAGEAGKGFAVVAGEVKSLASQTAKATEEISTKIGEMQASTERSVDAIAAIAHTIERINEIATTIASAVEEQGAATGEITRNVLQASSGTKDVSSSILVVNQAATDTGAASAQVTTAASELARQSAALRGQVDQFIVNVRSA